MIKKHLTIWFFIVSILSYSSVWATHSHDDFANQDQTTSVVDTHINADEHQLDSDHCCHASVHLIGLFNTHISELAPVKHVVESEYNVSIFTHSTSPPQRPPLS